MKIDITKGIKVGGFDYAVDTTERAHKDLRADNDAGQCDLLNHTLSIDIERSEQAISKTFIHEVIEAVNHIYCDNKIEHEKIQQLSFGIHQVMESLGVQFGVEK